MSRGRILAIAIAAGAVCARVSPPRAAPAAVSLTVDVSAPLFTVWESYVSVNLDTGSLANGLDLTSPVLRALLRNLVRAAPTQLRVGGGAADDTYFTGAGGARGPCSVAGHPDVSICVDASLWDELTDACAATGARLVWDLNLALNRTSASAPWYAANAAALIGYAAASGRSPYAWQLGNEMEDWYKRSPPLNVTGARVAADYAALRALLQQHAAAGVSQTVYGPDACCEDRHTPVGGMLRDFSAAAPALGLAAITFHEYPLPRAADRACIAAGYTNLTEIAGFLAQAIAAYAGYAAPALAAGIPLVLGETATTALGGCDALSNRFVAGFTFLHTLGAAAEARIAQVNRQDLAGWSSATTPSAYALLGPPGWMAGALAPHPDYFVALLFKQLVARAVLASALHGDAGARADVGVHAWCATAAPGALALTFTNVRGEATALDLPPALAALARDDYILTAAPGGGGNLTSDVALLNGLPLAARPDGTLAVYPLPGQTSPPAQTVTLPPFSLGFIVLPAARAPACM